MNILYGVQATGNGHISRSRELVRELKLAGHQVSVLFSGRKENELWDVEELRPYSVKDGFTFATENGRIRVFKTLIGLKPLQFFSDIRNLDLRPYDVIISDYEPVIAWAAPRQQRSVIGIGHQYAFRYPIPTSSGDLLSRGLLRSFAPVDIPIGLHWHPFNSPILPPVVPPALLNAPDIRDDNFILVYLSFESAEDVRALLQPFPEHKFIVYGSGNLAEPVPNIEFCSPSRNGFLHDLKHCSGVICNAGFELPGEALHIGKKLLVKPLKGQLEQESNALALTEKNLGWSMSTLDPDSVARFLNADAIQPQNYVNVARELALWIGSGDSGNLEELSRRCWPAE